MMSISFNHSHDDPVFAPSHSVQRTKILTPYAKSKPAISTLQTATALQTVQRQQSISALYRGVFTI